MSEYKVILRKGQDSEDNDTWQVVLNDRDVVIEHPVKYDDYPSLVIAESEAKLLNTLQAENDALRQRVAKLEEYNAKAIKTLESLEAMNIRQHDEIQLGIRVTLYLLRMPKPTTD